MDQLHHLLTHQIEAHVKSGGTIPDELAGLISDVNAAYHQFDEDRKQLLIAMDSRPGEPSKVEAGTGGEQQNDQGLGILDMLDDDAGGVEDLHPEMMAFIRELPEMVFLIDDKGGIHDCKTGTNGDICFTINELFENKIQDVPQDATKKKFYEAVWKVRETQATAYLDYAVTNEKGDHHYDVKMIPSPANRIMVVVRNTTEQKRAKTAIARSDALSRQLLERSPIAMMVYQDEKIVLINPSGLELLGAENSTEILARPYMDIVHPDHLDGVRERLAQFAKARLKVVTFQEVLRRSDGAACETWVAVLPHVHEGRPANQLIFCDTSHGKKIKALEEALKEAGEEMNGLRLKLRDLEEYREASEAENLVFQERLQKADNDKQELASQNGELQENLNQAQEDLAASETQCRALQEKQSELEEAKEAAESKSQALEERLERLEETHAGLETLNQETLEKVDELEKATAKAEAERLAMEDESRETREALETAEAEKRDLELKVRDLEEFKEASETESLAYQTRLKKAEETRETVEEENCNLKEKLEETVAAKEKAEEEVLECQDNLKNMEMAKDAARAESMSLHERVKKAEEARETAEDECLAYQEKVTESQEAVEAAESESRVSRSKVMEIEKEKDMLIAERQELQERVMKAEEACDTAENESLAYQEKVTETQEVLEAAENEGVALREKLEKAEEAGRSNEEARLALEEKQQEARVAMEKAETEIRELHEKLARAEAEKEAADEVAETEKGALQKRIDELESLKNASLALDTDFKEQLKELEMAKDAAKAETLDLKEKLKDLSRAKEEAEAEKEALEEQLKEAADLEEVKKALAAEKEDLEEKLLASEKDREAGESENRILQERISEISSVKEMVETEKEALEQKIEAFEKDREIAEARLSELEARLETSDPEQDGAFKTGKGEGAVPAGLSHEHAAPVDRILELTDAMFDTSLTSDQHQDLIALKDCALGLKEALHAVRDMPVIEGPQPKLILETPVEALRADSGESRVEPQEEPSVETHAPAPEAPGTPEASETPEEPPSKSPVNTYDLHSLLDEICERVGHEADDKGLALVKEIGENVPIRCEGDPLPLKQILLHMAENAVNFTDKGSVTLRVEAEGQDRGSVDLHFSIQDTGIGVPPEKLKAINAHFSEESDGKTQRFEGAGMGMSLAKKLLAKIGGKLWLESEQNQGSTFHLGVAFKATEFASKTVPEKSCESFGMVDLDSPKPAVEKPGGRLATAEDAIRLLFVQNEISNHDEVLPLIEKTGFPLDRAGNTHEARELLGREVYHLVFMDVNLSSLGDVAEMLKTRSDLGLGAMPILAITDEMVNEEREIMTAMGLNRCFSKPFDEGEWDEMLREFLPDGGVSEPAETATELDVSATEDAATVTEFDLSATEDAAAVTEFDLSVTEDDAAATELDVSAAEPAPDASESDADATESDENPFVPDVGFTEGIEILTQPMEEIGSDPAVKE